MSDENNLEKLNNILFNSLENLDSKDLASNDQITQAITVCKLSKQVLDIHKVRNQKEAIKLAYLTPSQKREIGKSIVPMIEGDIDNEETD